VAERPVPSPIATPAAERPVPSPTARPDAERPTPSPSGTAPGPAGCRQPRHRPARPRAAEV